MIGQLKYGDVIFSLTKINDVVRRPIYSEDGMDYVCTETIVDFMAVLNPKATAYASLGAKKTLIFT